MKSVVRIGCGGAFWGDSVEGARQLVEYGEIDYLILDYLAEITMSILARMKARDGNSGYATDSLDGVIKPLLPALAACGIRVVTNAGGMNPVALKQAIDAEVAAQGLSLSVAAVTGDDLADEIERLRSLDVREMSAGTPLPQRLMSANAYLGATPIAAALAAGADIVITGRCVDSALALGPLMHEFSWTETDYDHLAAGSLVGHVIECGTQCTGGLFTDWDEVPGWDNMGYPIAVCQQDGSFEIIKPPNTGGLLTPATVAEQIVYEIDDPASYRLPDVTADFASVTVEPGSLGGVRVVGACGREPGAHYKLCATYSDGYRATATMMIGGIDARAKAERTAAAILERTRRLFQRQGWDDYHETSVEILGSEATYGPHARALQTREVILKIAVRHAEKAALELFGREIYPAATSMAQGITGFAGGRPTPQPVVRLFSCLVPKSTVSAGFTLGQGIQSVPVSSATAAAIPPVSAEALEVEPIASSVSPSVEETRTVPLVSLAHARSGDKGDSANIGVLARRVEFVDLLRAQLSAARVADWFRHLVRGPVRRYEWPGLQGFNFVMEHALGGGGVASLRHDPQGKALAQMLLDIPIEVPRAWLDHDGILAPPASSYPHV